MKSLYAIWFAAVALLLAIALISVAAATSGVFTRHDAADPDQLKLQIMQTLSFGNGLPRGTKILAAEDRTGRDSEWWAKLQLPRGTSMAYKQDVISHVSRLMKGWTVDDSDANTVAAVTGIMTWPAWWDPTTLPDPDALLIRRGGGEFFVFSRETDVLYVVSWRL
jgi:hypothetical protein